MGGIFSKKKDAAPSLSVQDKALLDLKVSRDRLDKARKQHESQRQVYVDKARELLKAKKKDQAKLALRLKKLRDTQISKLTDQLFNLEKLVNDVQWGQYQQEIVSGIKAGNQALKELQLDPDEVSDLMAETQEAMDRQQEIDAILGENLNPEDEQDVLFELEAMESAAAAELDASLPAVPAVDPVAKPVVPAVDAGAAAPSAVAAGDVAVEAVEAAAPAEERQAVLA